MKLRQFISILGVVALVAVIYSPSTIGFSASAGGDGGTAPTDTSASGTSMFISYLQQSGYHVTVANTTQQVMTDLGGQQKVVYVLVGPDNALPSSGVTALKNGYTGGRVSLLIAEGNTTNSALLRALGAAATGAPISDPTSSFQNDRVFDLHLRLGTESATGVIDIASPLLINRSSTLHVAAATSPSSTDSKNASEGPRTVIAEGASASGARAVILTDSAPFTNFLFNYSQPGVNERSFVATMLAWVDPGKNTTLLLDSSLYALPKPPSAQAGLPVGPLVTYGIEQSISTLNGYYASYPSQVSGFLAEYGINVSNGVASALVALLLLLSVYGAVTRWFAPEIKGKDDKPPPLIERTVVAQSKAKGAFLKNSKSKEGCVSTLVQLYGVLDSIVVREFGSGLSSTEESELAARVGVDQARRAKRLFLLLAKISDHAAGNRMLLFPPVLRWRALTARTTAEAEAFLNRLGITIASEWEREEKEEEADEAKKAREGAVEYLSMERVSG